MNLRKYIIIIFSIMPLVDTLSGIGYSYNISIIEQIGTVYRLLLLGFMFYKVLKLSENRKLIIGITLFFITIPLFHWFYHSSILGIVHDYMKLFKLGIIILIPIFFRSLVTYLELSKDIITNIFTNLSIWFPITLIPPFLLNLGQSIYSNGAGFKGFYYANNDLTILLLVLVIICLDDLTKNLTKKNVVLFVLNLICLLLTATKTSMIGLLVVIVFYFKSITKIILSKKSFIFYLVLLIIPIYMMKDNILNEFELTIERNQFYQNQGMDSFTLLLGSRNIYLKEQLAKGISPLAFLFGQGEYNLSLSSYKYSIEMDFFDTFFIYGIVFTIVLYLSFIKKYIYYRNKNKTKCEKKYIVSFYLIMGFSFFAGHVLYSAMAGTILALILAYFSLNSDLDQR